MKIKKIPYNYVALNVPKDAYDSFKYKEMELLINPQVNYSNHVIHTGIVEMLPEELTFNKKDPNSGLKWLTDNELQIGDTVWVSKRDMINALGNKCVDNRKNAPENRFIENEDESLTVIIKYDDIRFVKRGDEYFSINGWLIIEPMEEENINTSLLIPDTVKIGYSKRVGRILYASNTIYDYSPFYGDSDNFFDIQKGDIVFLPKYGDLELENELHSIIKQKCFVVHKYRIKATEKYLKDSLGDIDTNKVIIKKEKR